MEMRAAPKRRGRSAMGPAQDPGAPGMVQHSPAGDNAPAGDNVWLDFSPDGNVICGCVIGNADGANHPAPASN